MIITTTEKIEGEEIIETLGLTKGSTVRSRNIAHDIIAGLKTIIGGEVEEYTKLQANSRDQAIQRMTEDAENMGADAIVSMRLATSMLAQGTAEILAYGTAVKLKQYDN